MFILKPFYRRNRHSKKKKRKKKKKTNPAKKRDPATQGSDVSPVPSDQGKGQKRRWLL